MKPFDDIFELSLDAKTLQLKMSPRDDKLTSKLEKYVSTTSHSLQTNSKPFSNVSEKLDETVKPNQAVKNHLAESSRTNLAENLAKNSFVGLTENLEISTWRRVKFAPGHYIFIYSAFFDDRIRPNVIRLNVLAPLRYIKTHGRTRCLVETRDGEISSTFGQLEILREHFSLPWASHYVLCDTANKNVIAFDLLCVLSTNFLLV